MFTLKSAADIRRKFPHLPKEYIAGIDRFSQKFRFGVSEETLDYLEKDEFGVPLYSDRLARLYWPFPELAHSDSEAADYKDSDNWEFPDEFPILENSAWHWKYPDRICFRMHRCQQYCLHCFESNRTMKKDTAKNPREADWAEGVAFTQEHPEIREVIFTGGEPLSMSDRRLDQRLADLRKPELSHVKSIRIHTAKGKHDTDRLSVKFAHLCKKHEVTEIALHIVHPRQVTERFVMAVGRLADVAGSMLRFAHIPLISGVNDSTKVMEELCVKLGKAGVKPYYALLEMPTTSGIKMDRLSVSGAVQVMKPLVDRRFVHMLCPEPIILARGGKKTIPMHRTHFWLHQKQVQESVWAVDGSHQPLEDFALAREGELLQFDGTPDFMYSKYDGKPVIVFKNWKGQWEMYPDTED